MLVQWLQIYETDLSVVISILKALSPHFEDYHLYNVDDSNILVVARRGKPVPDPDPAFLGRWTCSASCVAAGSWASKTCSAGGSATRRCSTFVALYRVPVNSDYFPFVDQNAARFRFMNQDARQLPDLTMLPVPFLQLALPEWGPRPLEPAPDF